MSVGPHTRNERGLRTGYPYEEGRTAETTKQTVKKHLSQEIEQKSLVRSLDKTGIYKR